MAQTHSLDLERSSSQFASITDAAQTGLDITGDFTVEAWIKLEALPSTPNIPMGIVAKFASAVGFRVSIINTDKVRIYYGNGSETQIDSSGAYVTSADVGKWIHFAVAVDVSARTMSLYKNGRSVATTLATAGDVTVGNNTADFWIGRIDGNQWYFDGFIKDVRVFSDIRTQAEIVADARTENVSDANLVGEWNLNGVYTDTSGNSNTLTASGSPVFSVDIPWEAPTSVESSAYVLDLEASSSQYAQIADASQTGLDLSGDFTIEAWVTLESEPASGQAMIFASKWDTSSNQRSILFYYSQDPGFQLQAGFSSNGSSGSFPTASVRLPVGVRTHVALTYNAAAGTCIFYVNGVSVGTGSSLPTSLFNSSAAFSIGKFNNAGTPAGFFDGLIKDVRVFNDIRTQAEIISDALSATVSNANLVGEWSFNNSYADTSGNNNTLTATGSPVFRKWANRLAGGLVSYYTLDEVSGNRADSHGGNTLTDNNTVGSAAGKKSNAADFEAANTEYLSAADNAALSLTTNLSILGWVNIESLPADRSEIVSKPNTTGNGYGAYHLEIENNAGTYNLRGLTDVAGTPLVTSYAWNPSTATWYHIAYTRNSTTGRQELYVNGICVASTANTTGAGTDSTHDLYLGKFGSATALLYDGLIDELAIYARDLEYGDILDHYNASAAITYDATLAVLAVDVFDALSLAEATTTEGFSFVAIGDDLAVAESTTQSGEAYLSVNDALTAEDSATLNTSPFVVEIDDLNKWGVVVF